MQKNFSSDHHRNPGRFNTHQPNLIYRHINLDTSNNRTPFGDILITINRHTKSDYWVTNPTGLLDVTKTTNKLF